MKAGLLSLSMVSLDGPPEQLAANLVAAAANFLGAGGVVTLSEWAALSAEEQRALHSAAQAREVENARTLAREILRGQLDPAALLGIAAPDEKAAG